MRRRRPNSVFQTLERSFLACDIGFGVQQRRAVVGTQEEKTQRVGRIATQRLAHRDDVAYGLAHLIFAEPQHSVVHPKPGKRDFISK